MAYRETTSDVLEDFQRSEVRDEISRIFIDIFQRTHPDHRTSALMVPDTDWARAQIFRL